MKVDENELNENKSSDQKKGAESVKAYKRKF
jgi:hypothetical protein